MNGDTGMAEGENTKAIIFEEVEAGGNGDCFYYSIAQLLARSFPWNINDSDDTAVQAIQRTLGNATLFQQNGNGYATDACITLLRSTLVTFLNDCWTGRENAWYKDRLTHSLGMMRTTSNLKSDDDSLTVIATIRDLPDTTSDDELLVSVTTAINKNKTTWACQFELEWFGYLLTRYGLGLCEIQNDPKDILTKVSNLIFDEQNGLLSRYNTMIHNDSTQQFAPRILFLRNVGNYHWMWVKQRNRVLGQSVGMIFNDISNILGTRQSGGAGLDVNAEYLCDPSSKASNLPLPMSSADRNAGAVARAVVAALQHNEKVTVNNTSSVNLNVVGISYNRNSLITLKQIEDFLRLSPIDGIQPHLIVQYIVTVIAMTCIAEDIRSPGSGQCNENAMQNYLSVGKLNTTFENGSVKFPNCMNVDATPAYLVITLIPSSPNPLSIRVDFKQVRPIPPFMISMILINFMGGAAIERLTGKGQLSKTIETWSKLIGRVQPQGQQQGQQGQQGQ